MFYVFIVRIRNFSTMSKRDQSLLFWLNDFAIEEPEQVTNIAYAFDSKKFKVALEKLLPKELLPKEGDSIVYVYVVILALLKRHGIGSTFKNALKQNPVEDNEIVLFFLYALFRQTNKDFEIKEQYSKAESMYQKWLAKNLTQSPSDFHFDSLTLQLEESNEEKKKEIQAHEKEYEEQQKELQKLVDDVKSNFDNLFDEASKKAADEERKRESLLKEKKDMDIKLSTLQEKLREINEQYEKIPEMEKENQDLSKRIEESKKEKEKLEEKQKEMSISGMTIQKMDEQIQNLREEITNLKTEYEALSNKQIEDNERTEAEIEKYKNLLIELEERVQKTDPEVVIQHWTENIQREIERTKEETKRIQLVVDLGSVLL